MTASNLTTARGAVLAVLIALSASACGGSGQATYVVRVPHSPNLYLKIVGPKGGAIRPIAITRMLSGSDRGTIVPSPHGRQDCTYTHSIGYGGQKYLRKYIGQKMTVALYGKARSLPRDCQLLAQLFPTLSRREWTLRRLVAFVNCDRGGQRVRPPRIVLSCANGSFYATGLRWAHWGGGSRGSAYARGIGHINLCSPSCAAGHFRTYALAVKLSRPRLCFWPNRRPHRYGGGEFTRISWRFLGSKPSRVKRSGTEAALTHAEARRTCLVYSPPVTKRHYGGGG
jgi:hypothetical protein